MAKTSVVQVAAYCSTCRQESRVDPSTIGRPHRKHIKSRIKNGKILTDSVSSKWTAGSAPKEAPSENTEQGV